jgi:C-terminal processing protease CtpA/Prc
VPGNRFFGGIDVFRNSIRLGSGLAWLLLAASLAVAYRAQAAEPASPAEERASAQARAEEARAQEEERAAAQQEALEAAQARAEEARAQEEERSTAQQEKLEAELEEAQTRLEEAARRVAELSARLTQDGLYFSLRGLDAIGPRPMLGVNIGRTPENKEPGVHVVGVTPDGPADRAGLRSGDVLLAIDDEDLVGADGDERLTAFMKGVQPGQEVRVRYRRDGKEVTTTVAPEEIDPMRLVVGAPGGAWEFDLGDLEKLGRLEDLEALNQLEDGPDFHFRIGLPGQWGDLELVSLTPKLGDYFDAESGLLVVRAPDDGTLGLQDGDVILAIDGRQPTSPRHAMRILRSYEPGETISFSIVREKKPQILEVDLPRREATGRRHDLLPPPPPPAPARTSVPPDRPAPLGT